MQIDSTPCSELTRAEILGYFLGFPSERAAAFCFDFFEVERHALARFESCVFTEECVNAFVFFAGHEHPVRGRSDTSRDCAIGRGLVDEDDGYDNDDRDHCDCGGEHVVRVRLQLIRLDRGGKSHAEKANQSYAPQVS
jgi:hypothetical protein